MTDARPPAFRIEHHYYEVGQVVSPPRFKSSGVHASVYQILLDDELVHTRYTSYEADNWIAGYLFHYGMTPEEINSQLRTIHAQTTEYRTPPTMYADATGFYPPEKLK